MKQLKINRTLLALSLSGCLALTVTGCGNSRKYYIVEPDEKESETSKSQNKNIDNGVELNESEQAVMDEMKASEQVLKESAQTDGANSASFQEKVSSYYQMVKGFLFDDQPIKGLTFSELTDSAKQKFLNFVDTTDQTIEKIVPNYKEKISNSAKNGYELVMGAVHRGQEKFKTARDDGKFNEIWNEIKENTNQAWANTEPIRSGVKEWWSLTKPTRDKYINQLKPAADKAKEVVDPYLEKGKDKINEYRSKESTQEKEKKIKETTNKALDKGKQIKDAATEKLKGMFGIDAKIYTSDLAYQSQRSEEEMFAYMDIVQNDLKEEANKQKVLMVEKNHG